MQYRALFKIAADNPRCGCCNRPLKTGIGVRIEHETTGKTMHVGPVCLEKMTGVKHYSVPVVSAGAFDETGEDSPAAAPHAGDDMPHKGKAKTAHREASAAPRDPMHARRLEAQANIWLRGKLLPEKGFSRIAAAGFAAFVPHIGSLDDDDVRAVEDQVFAAEELDGQPGLETLQHCMLTAVHIDSLLSHRKLWKGHKEFIGSLRKSLTTFHGLTDRQMDALEKITVGMKKNGVPNRIENIRFPKNQERLERSRPAPSAAEQARQNTPSQSAPSTVSTPPVPPVGAPVQQQLNLF
jgi:hypothetical protein